MCFHPVYRNVLEGPRGLTDDCRFLQTIEKLFLESFLQFSRIHFFKMQSSASRYIFYLLLCLFSLLVVKQNMCMSPLSRPKHGVGCNSKCLRITLASSFCSFTIVKIIISFTTILLFSHSIVVLIITTNYW